MRKLLSTAVAIGIFTSTSLLPAAYADVTATTLPVLNSADSNVNVTSSGAKMNIQINGGMNAVGTAEWKTFDIGKDAHVNVEFTSHHQTSVNKVLATGGMSEIYGKFTDSSAQDCCGYNSTGKIILLNPNGVLFGTGANVDVNSITASTLKGTYNDPLKNGAGNLVLERNGSSGNGIVVQKDAVIRGKSNVALISDKVEAYKGSQILTANTDTNGNVVAGQVKIVTTDGVTFNYSNYGGGSLNSYKSASDKLTIGLNGEIHTGALEVKNASAGQLNIDGAKIKVYKANKAVSSVDGNIRLAADNDIVIDGADIAVDNLVDWTSTSGNVIATAGNKLSVKDTTINNKTTRTTSNTLGDIRLTATNSDAIIAGSTITSDKNINVTASNGLASIQTNDGLSSGKGSTLTAANADINITGKTAQVQKSTLNAKNINVTGDSVYTASNAVLNAADKLAITSKDGIASFKNTTNKAKTINITSEKDSVKFSDTTNTADEITVESYKTIAYNNTSSSNIIQTGSTPTFNAGDIQLTSINGNVILKNEDPYAPFKSTRSNLTLDSANKDVNVIKTASGNLDVKNIELNAGQNILLKAEKGDLNLNGGDSVKIAGAKVLALEAYDNGSVKTTNGTFGLSNIKTQIVADKDINVTVSGANNQNKGLIATTNKGDITITVKNANDTALGDLAVAKIVSAKDVTINAANVKRAKGFDLADNINNYYTGFDGKADRGYIEVGADNDNDATFTYSNGTTTITNYKKLNNVEEGTSTNGYIKQHHVDFIGDNAEGKIYLVQKVKDDNGKTTPATIDPNTKGAEATPASLGGDSAGDTNSDGIGSSRTGSDIGGNGGTTPEPGPQPTNPDDCTDKPQNEIGG